MAENAPPPAPAKADPPSPPSPPQLTLVAKNESTVQGIQYFNVFPPPLDVSPAPPPQELTVVPTVSDATNNSTQPKAVLKWPAPPAMSLIALKRGDGMGAASPTPVTPGSTVTINWQDGAFAIVATPGTGDTIKLTFEPGIPARSRVCPSTSWAAVMPSPPRAGAHAGSMRSRASAACVSKRRSRCSKLCAARDCGLNHPVG